MTDDPVEQIRAMLAEKAKALSELDTRRVTLDVEVRTLAGVIQMLEAKVQPPRQTPSIAAQIVAAHLARKTPTRAYEALDGFSARRISSHWRAVLKEMAEAGGDLGYNEIMALDAAKAADVTFTAARTKMNDFVREGFLERPRDGVFRVTPKGAALAGVESEVTSGNATAEPAASGWGALAPAQNTSTSPAAAGEVDMS